MIGGITIGDRAVVGFRHYYQAVAYAGLSRLSSHEVCNHQGNEQG